MNNIGYTRYKAHERWEESTSSSEKIWNVLKGGNIDTYKDIQNKDFMFFLKE